MVLIYVAAAKGNDEKTSPCAIRAEVYRGKEVIYTATKMTEEPNIEKAYLKALVELLDEIQIEPTEKVTLFTTTSIAKHGNDAMLSDSGYPNKPMWKQAKKRLLKLEYLPTFMSNSRWGETILAEAQEYAAEHV